MARNEHDEDEPPLTEAQAAEREVIGCVLAVPDMLRYAFQVGSEDFAVAGHRSAWKAITRLAEDRDDITVRAVASMVHAELRDVPRDMFGTMSDAASASVGTMKDAVARVIDASRRRRLIEVWNDARRQATRSDEPLDVIVAKTMSSTDTAALGRRSRFMTGREAGDKLRERLLKPNSRIPTGLHKFDAVLDGGLPAGRMIAIIGKPKTGKTTMVSTISYNLQVTGVPHLVIALERSETDMTQMAASRRLGISVTKLERDFQRHAEAYDQFMDDPMQDFCHYHHAAGNTLDEIRFAILRAVRMYGVKVVLIDYYQIIECPPKTSLNEHLSRVAQTIANLIAALDVCCVMTAQADVDGLPRDCRVLYHSAAANFVIRRAIDQAETWLENIGSNFIANINVGSPRDPGMMLDANAGPHFHDA